MNRTTFVEEMEGFITEETRREDAARITPEDAKEMWIRDLPIDDSSTDSRR